MTYFRRRWLDQLKHPSQCVSSVYFMYDPTFEKYSLGKVDDLIFCSPVSRLTVIADECVERDFLDEGNS